MKKQLRLLTSLLITTGGTALTSACSDFPAPTPTPPTPPDPPAHDVEYYKKDIVKQTNLLNHALADLKEWLTDESKKTICKTVTECADWIHFKTILEVEILNYKITIQDDNYKIIVLEAKDKPNFYQKQEMIGHLETEISFLTCKLKLMKTVTDYKEKEMQAVLFQIEEITDIINHLLYEPIEPIK